MLEILISIGLILVGLLGVAALLPVGDYDMVTSLRANRGAACARAAMRDLVVRGMLDQTQWMGIDLWNQRRGRTPRGHRPHRRGDP